MRWCRADVFNGSILAVRHFVNEMARQRLAYSPLEPFVGAKNAGAVRRFSAMSKLATWLQAVPVIPPPIRLLQIGSAFWQSRVLHVAARLDIATVLGDQAMNIDDVATRVQQSRLPYER